MTREESAKIIFSIRAAYPVAYRNIDNTMLTQQVALWTKLFADVPYQQIDAALQAYILGNSSGFPPDPGQINAYLHTYSGDAPEISRMEAWAMVRHALENSGYHAEEEFQRLPALVRQAVGTPANLKEMSQLPTSQVETVEQSNFLRTYDTVVKRAQDDAKIPASIRGMIAKMPLSHHDGGSPEQVSGGSTCGKIADTGGTT